MLSKRFLVDILFTYLLLGLFLEQRTRWMDLPCDCDGILSAGICRRVCDACSPYW